MNPAIVGIISNALGSALGTGITNGANPPVTIERPRPEPNNTALYIAAGAAVLLIALIIYAVVSSKKK